MEKVFDDFFWGEDVKVYRTKNDNDKIRVVVGSEIREGFDREEYVFELKKDRYEFVYGFSVEDGFLVRCYPNVELVEFLDGWSDFGVRPVN